MRQTLLLLPMVLACTAFLHGQTALETLKQEPNPTHRAEKALSLAEEDFDAARAAYEKGEIGAGDTQLEQMTKVLDECVDSLEMAHKSRLYKRAELRVAHLQRRMVGLVDDLNFDQRGWAEQTSRQLNKIHDKLLEGAMKR